MGNKIFKGMKFPGMDDYYVLPEAVITKNEDGIIEIESCLTGTTEIENLDASLTKEGYAADAKAVGGALEAKAPAGYGLGEVAPSGLIQTTAALDAAKATGWYRFYGYDSGSYWDIGGYLSGLIEVKGSRTATDGIRQYFYPDGCNAYLVRMMAGGAWSKWEWVNPPMLPDVEYRTTERHNGKAVYAQCVYFGYLPAEGEKQKAFTNVPITQLINMQAIVQGPTIDEWYDLNNVDVVNMKPYVLGDTVFVGTSGEFGWDSNVYIFLKYTKD